MPRLIEPFLANHSSPEELFKYFDHASSTATTDVQAFRRYFDDMRSKLIFRHVRSSRSNNSEGISSWRVTECSDWLSKEEQRAPIIKAADEHLDDVEEPGVQDINNIIETFSASHTEIKVKYDRDHRLMKVYSQSPENPTSRSLVTLAVIPSIRSNTIRNSDTREHRRESKLCCHLRRKEAPPCCNYSMCCCQTQTS